MGESLNNESRAISFEWNAKQLKRRKSGPHAQHTPIRHAEHLRSEIILVNSKSMIYYRNNNHRILQRLPRGRLWFAHVHLRIHRLAIRFCQRFARFFYLTVHKSVRIHFLFSNCVVVSCSVRGRAAMHVANLRFPRSACPVVLCARYVCELRNWFEKETALSANPQIK